MMAVRLIVIWGLTAIAAAAVAFVVAGIKNRDNSAWAAWTFLFPPIALALFLTPRNNGPRPRRPSLDELEH